jgi:competence protein ComEC
MNRWPLHKAYAWESAPFLRILLPFAAGVLCYDRLAEHLSFINCISFSGVCYLLLMGGYLLREKMGVKDGVLFGLVTLFLIAAGMSAAALGDIRNDKQWFGHKPDEDASYMARITAAPIEKARSWKVRVAMLRKRTDTATEAVHGDAIVYLEKDETLPQLQAGDTILLPGYWQRITDAGNPFEFSYADYCAHNNIYYSQACAAEDVALVGSAAAAAQPLTQRAHYWCMDQLQRYLGNHKAMGLMQAMLLGDEVHLDDDLRRAYTETGIVHIIAISGGNIAVFFAVVAFLLAWIRHRRYLWVKYAVALPVVWFYVVIAGAQPSATRAAVMFSILALGMVLQKNTNPVNQLLATAFVLLFAVPSWLFSVGFQLSFLAVLSILVFYRPVYAMLPLPVPSTSGKGIKQRLRKWLYGVPKALWSVCAMSIAAELLVAPLVILYFHTFPVAFIVANVAAYVFMGVVLILGMCLVVLSPLHAVASMLATSIKYMVDAFGEIVAQLQGVGPASFSVLVLSGAELVVVYVGIAGFALFLLRRRKPGLFVGMAAVCVLLLSFCRNEWVALRQQRLVVYNATGGTTAELINGKSYAAIGSDADATSRTAYTTNNAHIGWRATHRLPATVNEVFRIGDKTVLFAAEPATTEGHFPVDYLVVDCAYKPDIAVLLHSFTPGTVVLAGGGRESQQQAIAAACADAGVVCHAVADEGAFVLDGCGWSR